jgi:hypothetical protein
MQPTIVMKSMPRFALIAIAFVIALTSQPKAQASSTLPLSTTELMTGSDAVFRGTVVGISTARGSDGLIYTRTSLRVAEAFKGKFPDIVAVEHRGGQVGSEEEFYGLSPRLLADKEYLLFLKRDVNGKLHCTQGHASAIPLVASTAQSGYDAAGQKMLDEVRAIVAAGNAGAGSDVTDQVGTEMVFPQATSGMLNGINSRFLPPDRGEPIAVLIDAASLPAGISLSQATNAVLQALNAWAAVTSLKFKIESIGSFGQGADAIAIPDEKLRIQLHDNFNRITTANVLGIGGRNASSLPSPVGWDIGGNVAGNEFRKSTYGYVVLESGSASLQNLATFAEVLCHEVGHALNMAHSSEVFTADPVLFNSIMYYQAHADGRGATLGAYDPPVIRQCYPSNTVPFIPNVFPLHRVIDATTASSTLNLAGINEVEIRGYDLQTAALTLVTSSEDAAAGSFALSGNLIKYVAPVGNFSDTSRFDPQIDVGSSFDYYAVIYARMSDGTNASPYTAARVISLRRDGVSIPDGLPNYWMINYFGNATPSAGTLSRATDDADGDGFNNLQEYRMGTNPKDAGSALRINTFSGNSIQFPAQAYELYEIMGSTNLADWTFVSAVTPTNSLALRTLLPQTNILVTVSNLPATASQMFYRVRKVP